ncbi:mRNA surveillance protein pelota [Halapricum hydrolyticum]|uniref:Protein pelota homolog n=1 Tax=Halapricum hydrolyticum TaxID=2979991 RepID=A0AAE3I8M6_9EURY|nr:mRNA surveillance protein pelota [Halapricum hydrolyticum]MCU4716674.1 mRNA surveillance protein pelota [Halapricum hydrolyticum]MCU4725721.1 mRNA surveillance protein pelota [Halapricum hydrolyticum]
MRIAERQPVEGGGERITVVPESLDDLWHLSHVIDPGDQVAGDTTRRIQRNEEELRDTGGEREHLWVKLDVEDVEFAKFANRLRVSGVIADCSREDQLGLHHTINVEEHTELDIEKVWNPDQLDRLKEAEEAADNPDVAIATVEEGQAYVHTIAQYGTDERASISGPTGKGDYARPREELFEELTAVLTRLDVDAIVLAGPGFTKQDALDYIEDSAPELAESITTVDTSAVGDRGVHEVLKRGAVEEIQQETRIANEAELIDELTERIATDEPVAYGPDEVAEAADYGAIEHLLVLDEHLRSERSGGDQWDLDADRIIETTEQKGGGVTVFSGEFDPGQQLSNLGGIAALLRYRIS